ncbi:MAG: hypothetical protein M1378_00190 [Bacteroidetes bacterium]|nr:hypothetical protein [Bacteroidota bacterium]
MKTRILNALRRWRDEQVGQTTISQRGLLTYTLLDGQGAIIEPIFDYALRLLEEDGKITRTPLFAGFDIITIKSEAQ